MSLTKKRSLLNAFLYPSSDIALMFEFAIQEL